MQYKQIVRLPMTLNKLTCLLILFCCQNNQWTHRHSSLQPSSHSGHCKRTSAESCIFLSHYSQQTSSSSLRQLMKRTAIDITSVPSLSLLSLSPLYRHCHHVLWTVQSGADLRQKAWWSYQQRASSPPSSSPSFSSPPSPPLLPPLSPPFPLEVGPL